MDNKELNIEVQIKMYNDILDKVKIKIDNINQRLDKYKINKRNNKVKEECGILDIFIW
jgi:hypothetical protein